MSIFESLFSLFWEEFFIDLKVFLTNPLLETLSFLNFHSLNKFM